MSLRTALLTTLSVAQAIVLLVACSSDPETAPVTTTPDASSATEAGDPSPAPDTGAPGKDTGTDAPASTGKTSLVASLNNVSRTLVRAQFGKSAPDAAKETFYVEAHEGGDPACPTSSSPTPKRTLILANIPRGQIGAKYTKADGVAATFFDFSGDQLQSVAPIKASAVTITLVAIDVGPSPADGSSLVELEVDAAFAEGTVKGHVAATYCKSLDD